MLSPSPRKERTAAVHVILAARRSVETEGDSVL